MINILWVFVIVFNLVVIYLSIKEIRRTKRIGKQYISVLKEFNETFKKGELR